MTTEINTAIDAVRAAAAVCQTVQRDLVTAQTLEKKDRSPVTVADFASQAIVCAMLGGDLPVVGEENAKALREDDAMRTAVCNHVRTVMRGASDDDVMAWIDRGGAVGNTSSYWTVDPIDGTKGFLRGEQYAVALALIENHRVVLGVLGCPNLHGGTISAAVLDHGARAMAMDGSWESAMPLHISKTTDPAEMRFCESVESAHSDQGLAAQLAKKLGIAAEAVRLDSQAKYAVVAAGEAEVYLRLPTRADYRENIWDHAAGTILMEEAGGTITDVDGKPLDYSHGRRFEHNRGVVGTNGPIHDRIINTLRELGV